MGKGVQDTQNLYDIIKGQPIIVYHMIVVWHTQTGLKTHILSSQTQKPVENLQTIDYDVGYRDWKENLPITQTGG